MKKKLLVVDDVEINRTIINELFCEDFEVIEAENGKIALELLAENLNDMAIVLLDVIMPVMDGFEVLEIMNRSGMINTIPVIMITGESDDQKAMLGYGMGVSDLVSKPFNPDIIYKRVNNVVNLYNHKRDLEDKLLEQKRMLERQALKLRQFDEFLIEALSTTVEFRNLESGQHIRRIRILTEKLLEMVKHEYNLSSEEIEVISKVSALHDIGKIAIPDSILLKPGKLTNEEFETMKTHTLKGCEILESLNYAKDMEFFNYSYEICRHHHERWDGNGYPDKLKGDEISIWAQATSLADVYDALTSERVYKHAYTPDEAVKMIVNGECGAFNPRLLDCFVQIQGTLK